MHPLNRLRLRSQWLVRTTPRTALEIVSHFGAVQSQELAPAMWALGVRAKGLTRTQVLHAYDRGEIVRTHVLRPTWHFVAACDARWMLALTAPRLRAAGRRRFAELGLDPDVVRRSRRLIERALGEGTPLTRAELVARMRREGLRLEGQQGYHLTFDAELEALICSGPLRGTLVTFALLDTRIPPVAPIARDEALATLVRRYVESHGPATLRDLAWWSGLTMSDVRRGLDILGNGIERLEIDGTALVAASSRVPPAPRTPVAHLLPRYDELAVAYVDRRALAGPGALKGAPRGALLADLVVVNGVCVGTWRRAPRAADGVELALQQRLGPAERDAVDRAIARYREFAGTG